MTLAYLRPLVCFLKEKTSQQSNTLIIINSVKTRQKCPYNDSAYCTHEVSSVHIHDTLCGRSLTAGLPVQWRRGNPRCKCKRETASRGWIQYFQHEPNRSAPTALTDQQLAPIRPYTVPTLSYTAPILPYTAPIWYTKTALYCTCTTLYCAYPPI